MKPAKHPAAISGAALLEERAREKQASRDADRRDLLSGRKSPAQLYRENSHFAGLRVAVDYRGGRDPE